MNLWLFAGRRRRRKSGSSSNTLDRTLEAEAPPPSHPMPSGESSPFKTSNPATCRHLAKRFWSCSDAILKRCSHCTANHSVHSTCHTYPYSPAKYMNTVWRGEEMVGATVCSGMESGSFSRGGGGGRVCRGGGGVSWRILQYHYDRTSLAGGGGRGKERGPLPLIFLEEDEGGEKVPMHICLPARNPR